MCARVGGCAAASGRLKHVAEFFTNGLNIVAALHSDPSDPDVIIKLDISNAFNVLCRQPTLDVLGGKASCDYACGLKEGVHGSKNLGAVGSAILCFPLSANPEVG